MTAPCEREGVPVGLSFAHTTEWHLRRYVAIRSGIPAGMSLT